MNCYAYLLARYDQTTLPNHETTHTFDLITIQLYEGYSHIEYETQIQHISPIQSIISFVQRLLSFEIDFSTDIELFYPIKQKIKIDINRLVIGLANGWAGDGKFLLVLPSDVSNSYVN